MRIRFAALLLLLCLLAGCSSSEPAVIDGELCLPYSDGGLSFYYPDSASLSDEEGYIFSALSEYGWIGISELDYAAGGAVLDENELLDSVCQSAINELCAQTGLDGEYFSVSDQFAERTMYGKCSALELSYTVRAQMAGYELDLSCSFAQTVLLGSDKVYVVTRRSDSADAAEIFTSVVSTIECK